MREPTDRARALRSFPELALVERELGIYENLLRRWQARINLVGPKTLDQIWWRHFADSAQLLPFAPSAKTWADLGSGGGFPGMVLALLLKSKHDSTVTLIESDSRKAAFLREVSRETGAPARVVSQRAETVIAGMAAPEVVVSRALASTDALIAIAKPWLGRTTGLFLVGEAFVAAPDANMCIEPSPSRTGAGFVVRVTPRMQG